MKLSHFYYIEQNLGGGKMFEKSQVFSKFHWKIQKCIKNSWNVVMVLENDDLLIKQEAL